MNELITALILQHADKLHLLFHGVQSTMNSVRCHQEGSKMRDQSKEQPAKWRGTIRCHLVATTESKPIRNQAL
jgi:hypothetical protein